MPRNTAAQVQAQSGCAAQRQHVANEMSHRQPRAVLSRQAHSRVTRGWRRLGDRPTAQLLPPSRPSLPFAAAPHAHSMRLVELPRSLRKRTRQAVACPRKCRHAPPPPLYGTFAHRPRPPSSRNPKGRFAAAAHVLRAPTHYPSALRHPDSRRAANHPRPRRPTGRLSETL